jgi:2-polyprenyl-3-methyl-5-hydroxy-6-metoxy-1,4-benzoquinol methylase
VSLSRILACKGIHYFVTRFGSQRLRSLAFDEKYRQGDWNFAGSSSGELSAVIRRYLRSGHLLMLGSGGATLLENFRDSEFDSVLGIDLSQEALRLANRFASPKISFQYGDMRTFQCPRSFDVILFSESLYYISVREARACLDRLSAHLTSRGVFVVTVAEPDRYSELLSMIPASFSVIESSNLPDSCGRLLVFRTAGSEGK